MTSIENLDPYVRNVLGKLFDLFGITRYTIFSADNQQHQIYLYYSLCHLNPFILSVMSMLYQPRIYN